MKTISDEEFLSWTAEAGLLPDPRYPSSRQQLVFGCSELCWGAWTYSTSVEDTEGTPPEQAIAAALEAAHVPEGVSGALEFDRHELASAVRVVTAFACFAYRVQTEVVNANRSLCLMFTHHRELCVQSPNRATLRDFSHGMAERGYLNECE